MGAITNRVSINRPSNFVSFTIGGYEFKNAA